VSSGEQILLQLLRGRIFLLVRCAGISINVDDGDNEATANDTSSTPNNDDETMSHVTGAIVNIINK
jgi:hypothetical protein